MFYPFSRSFLWSVLGCFCAGEDPETGRGRGKRLRSRSHFPILTTSTRFSQSFFRSEAGFSVISVKAYETLHNVVEFLMRPWDWFVFVFSDMLKFLMSNFPKFWPWKHAGLTVFGGNIMRLVHMLPHSCLFQKGLSMELRSIFIAQLLFLSILGWKLFFSVWPRLFFTIPFLSIPILHDERIPVSMSVHRYFFLVSSCSRQLIPPCFLPPWNDRRRKRDSFTDWRDQSPWHRKPPPNPTSGQLRLTPVSRIELLRLHMNHIPFLVLKHIFS